MNQAVESQGALFDYAALDLETRVRVQQRTGEIKSLAKRVASDIVDIGRKIAEVKASLKNGQFKEWLDAEFPRWSERTAYNFIAVWQRFGDADFAIDGIAPSALYLLAAQSTPKEARGIAKQIAEGGEAVSHATAKEIVRQAKARRPKQVVLIEEVDEEEGTGRQGDGETGGEESEGDWETDELKAPIEYSAGGERNSQVNENGVYIKGVKEIIVPLPSKVGKTRVTLRLVFDKTDSLWRAAHSVAAGQGAFSSPIMESDPGYESREQALQAAGNVARARLDGTAKRSDTPDSTKRQIEAAIRALDDWLAGQEESEAVEQAPKELPPGWEFDSTLEIPRGQNRDAFRAVNIARGLRTLTFPTAEEAITAAHAIESDPAAAPKPERSAAWYKTRIEIVITLMPGDNPETRRVMHSVRAGDKPGDVPFVALSSGEEELLGVLPPITRGLFEKAAAAFASRQAAKAAPAKPRNITKASAEASATKPAKKGGKK